MFAVGDLHNFGEFVRFENEKVFKPRTIFWEYTFLSSKSELRILIESICRNFSITSPFSVAPDLRFESNDFSNGYIQKLNLSEFENFENELESNSIASMIGMCFWFGIGDLHKDNLFVGRDSNSKLICFPLDIETIFDKMSHVHQTLLFSSEVINQENTGLNKILPRIQSLNEKNRIQFVKKFIEIINLLNDHSEIILKTVNSNEQHHDRRIRVIPRDTKTYKKIIEGLSDICDLTKEEEIQIRRGDIPYFFRELDSDKIYYYKNKNKEIDLVHSEAECFNKIRCVHIKENNQIDLNKTYTAIYSAGYIAEKLNLKCDYDLSECKIYGDQYNLSIKYSNRIELNENT